MTDQRITADDISHGMRGLRHRIADKVLAELAPKIGGLSAHFGESYEHTDEPEAVVYRTTGGTFRFLAIACAPWRMWDLHVGIVPLDETTLSIGFHISERAAPLLRERLESFARKNGLRVDHSPRAVEFQANLPSLDPTRDSLEAMVKQAIDVCRELAPAATGVDCPAPMRAGRSGPGPGLQAGGRAAFEASSTRSI
jgi:hypothetical protein